MINVFYGAYEFIKKNFNWRIKASAKGYFLDLFYYRRAAGFAKNQKTDPVKILFKKNSGDKKTIRILFVIPHLVFGGAERILFDAITALQKQGNECFLCCAVKTGEWVSKFEKICPVYDLSEHSKDLWGQKDALVGLINELKCNIVQFSNCEILYFAFPYIKAKTGAVTVNWIHVDKQYFQAVHHFGYRRFTGFIDGTVVVSPAMERHIVKNNFAPAAKVSVIRNGIDLSRFNPEPYQASRPLLLKKYGIPNNCQIVTFIGRLTQEKNPFDFLKIAKIVLNKLPQTHFIIAGEGYLKRKSIILANKLKISSSVRFLGLIDDIPGLLSISTVFVSTSITEGFGLAAAEAMAMGVPAVVFDVGGLNELIEPGCGYTVNQGNIADFSEKIITLLNDNLAQKKIGQNAKQRIISNFAIQNKANELKNFYRHLLAIDNK
jgi:glycosyltransferase involved in cell wall biosynthesis